MSRRFFVDSNVLLLAAGGQHTSRDACRRLVHAASDPEFELHASTEALQEFYFHHLRRTDRTSAITATRLLNDTLLVHDFDKAVLARMLDLVEGTELRGRDAVHAATAIENGFTSIVSADHDFDGIPGLTRVDPAAALS